MSTPSVMVFQTLAQKQGPSAAVLDELKQQSGFQRVFFGVKMEDPDTGVLCTEWSSADAARDYRSSQLASSLGAQPDRTLAFETGSQGWEAALSAPCTEVFTAFGAEDGFRENVRRFVAAVDKEPPEGYRGAAFGQTEGGENGDEGRERVVRMVIGWTSREAHLEAKGRAGAIQENIHELRVLRRAVDLFHVELKAL